jgi:hypothetical protein
MRTIATLALAALCYTAPARAQDAPPLQVSLTRETRIVPNGPSQDWRRRADITTYVHVIATDTATVTRVVLNGRTGQRFCDSAVKDKSGPRDDLPIKWNSFPRHMETGDEITIVWSSDCGQPIKVLIDTDKVSATYPIGE